MKLTKSGEIEACCEWLKDTEPRMYHIGTSYRISAKVHGNSARIVVLSMWGFPKNCPACGAKTEIEGGER